jgi:hypothetical protein
MSKVFTEHSQTWTAPKDALIMSTGGHLHDGGTSLQVVKESSDKLSVVCNSESKYSDKAAAGMSAGKVKRDGPHGHSDGPKAALMGTSEVTKTHIDHQETCLFPEGLPISKGDTIYLQANYDFNQHPGMKNSKGELDEVMGITGTLVVF